MPSSETSIAPDNYGKPGTKSRNFKEIIEVLLLGMRKRLYALPAIVTGVLAFAGAALADCNVSSYDANANHGLLKGIQPVCAVCGQCSIADIFVVGNTVVELILGLSGSVMLLMMVYGGFLFLTSSGNSSQIDKGKKAMLGAIIGVVIVFTAYTVVQFILGALGVPNVADVFKLPFMAAKTATK